MSLAELVLSFFLLSAGIIVVAQLFQTSLRRNADSGRAARAAMVAQSKLAEIRQWAAGQSAGAYNFDNWAPYTNVTVTDPDEPVFTVTVRSQDQTVGSLSTQLESTQTEQRLLTRSLRKVEITVSWSGGQAYRLVSLVGDPTRQLASPAINVQATSLANPLAAGATADFQGQILDSNNNPIPDVGFRWGVEAGTGDGMLDWVHRDQRSCRFINRYALKDGSTIQVPGTCWVRATSNYGGPIHSNVGPQMVLSP